ncbi:hypothetical protein INT47_010438 [Mucor saturninus]|uniref:Enkurin domain-containing protein n=1 Tax=Mucor saturninus TaxID=64648 RepID=A0A8H7RBG6_9FUNG|nr:hypothetical protein INT47_010438 [Mucor saturninus]
MSSIASVKSKDRPASAGQKFWPLKKFGLHHHSGKEEVIVAEPAKDLMEKDAQKKSKNKRLSSLLSSRRQEASIQNLQSHVNTPESIAADTKKQTNHASNTPTLTRKSGRDIVRSRINSQNTTVIPPNHKQNMTAKSAGSATLARSNTFSHFTPPCSPTPPLNKLRARELRNSTRRSSEDRFKRPQSPPKRNDSPTQQPHIMLESVQQQIQLDQLMNSMNDDVDNDSAIEEDDYEEDNISKKDIIPKSANTTKNMAGIDSSPPIKLSKKKVAESFIELKPDTKEEEKEEEHHQHQHEHKHHQQQQQQKQQQVRSPFCSPPLKPAAATGTEENLLELTRDDNSAAGIASINSEPPMSPAMCALDVQSVQQDENNLPLELPQQNTLYVQQQHQQQQQQPIQRINRLRPAASFATLRQLANSNNTFQYQQFSNNSQQQPIPQIKRRPVSFIESGQHVNYASPATSDDYLTVHRPAYYRRASSEDNRQFHTRQQSDTNQYSSRRLVRSNTVHNLIIKDGYGHRIVQCLGLDESQQQQQQQHQNQQPPLRRKNSSFESHDSFPHDWSPPTEVMDDSLFSNRSVVEEPYYQQHPQLQQQQHQQQQQQQMMIGQQDNTDASSSDSSSHHGSHRRIRRKDSAKSISSLCSTSPPGTTTGSDVKIEKLRSKLDKERATVKALQKQKEAYNKDVLFLSKNVDDLAADNIEWKKKFENEKTLKERFQDDLSSTMDKLNEATEQLRQLETQTRALKSEIDDKNKELRELEKKRPSKYNKTVEGKSSDRLLAAQLHHSQNQVRLLKSTMEQFLRMGVFNDDLNSSNHMTSPTTSIDAVVADLKSGRSRPQRRTHSPGNKSSTTHTPSEEKPNTAAATAAAAASVGTTATAATAAGAYPAISRSRKSLVPTEITETLNNTKTTKTPQQKKLNAPLEECTEELDVQLRELLREKELLQAEYSKAPSSGGNALVRRRREELESRLDTVDSQMCRIKLKMRSRNIL